LGYPGLHEALAVGQLKIPSSVAFPCQGYAQKRSTLPLAQQKYFLLSKMACSTKLFSVEQNGMPNKIVFC
jgi:hypothetical protein